MSNVEYDHRKLIEAREKQGYSKSQVARLLRTNWQTVYRAEKGEGGTSFKVLRSICALYGLPISEVVYLADPLGK